MKTSKSSHVLHWIMQLIIAINLFMSFIKLRYKTLQYFEDVCELKSYLLVFQVDYIYCFQRNADILTEQ